MSLLIVAAAALLQPTLPPSPAAESPVAESAPADATEIVDGDTDFYQRMTVPVRIEGQGPFNFMIDTGAQATVVTRGLSDQLALHLLGSATVVGMASRKVVPLVRVDGLEFAARTFDGIEAPLLEARHVGADGILGLDSLQDLRVLIDFRTDTIAVDDAKALGGNRGYEIIVRARRKLGRLIITDARVDGVETAVIIDTGAQGNTANLALQKRLRAKKLEQVRSTDVHGAELIGQMDIVKSLRIKDATVTNLPIAFADGPAFSVLGLEKRPALILGMRDLRLFDRVAIDFGSRTVLFDLPTNSGYDGGAMHRKFFPTRL